jgi:lactate dehydrogenase-like 2-hydroxyacid dehydrogenase
MHLAYRWFTRLSFDQEIPDHSTFSPSALVERLLPFDVVCVMRERTPLPREVLQHLPRLKLIASTGSRNASIDMGGAKELGITVTATRYRSSHTIELTWALILASLRGIVQQNNSIRMAAGKNQSAKILSLGFGFPRSRQNLSTIKCFLKGKCTAVNSAESVGGSVAGDRLF